MSFKVELSAKFEKEARRLIRKFPSLKEEIAQLTSSLKVNPKLGVPIGKNCFKIRLSILSKSQGKSGGARVITHVVVFKNKVFLITIYDKSDLDAISDADLKKLIKKLPE